MPVNPEPEIAPPRDETRPLRRAFSQFATGVCIVSAPPVADQRLPFAITVNSFASVSLQPPMILWSVQKDSTSYDLWMATGQFAVSVLHAGQAALCEHYAIRGNHPIRSDDEFRQSRYGNPLVIDALATFDCTVHAIHEAGDHQLILANVVDYDSDDAKAPLTYLRGQILG